MDWCHDWCNIWLNLFHNRFYWFHRRILLKLFSFSLFLSSPETNFNLYYSIQICTIATEWSDFWFGHKMLCLLKALPTTSRSLWLLLFCLHEKCSTGLHYIFEKKWCFRKKNYLFNKKNIGRKAAYSLNPGDHGVLQWLYEKETKILNLKACELSFKKHLSSAFTANLFIIVKTAAHSTRIQKEYKQKSYF